MFPYNTSTWEVESGQSQVQEQSKLQSSRQKQNKQTNKQKTPRKGGRKKHASALKTSVYMAHAVKPVLYERRKPQGITCKASRE